MVRRERVQQPTAEQIGDVHNIREETVEIVKTTSQDRIPGRSQFIEVPKTSCRGSAEVAKNVLQKSVSEPSQAIEVPKISCQRSVEAVKSFPQERSPERRCEQSEVTEVTETSSQDLWLGTPEQFLDETRHESLSRFRERGRELRVFGAWPELGGGGSFLSAVSIDFFKQTDALTLV